MSGSSSIYFRAPKHLSSILEEDSQVTFSSTKLGATLGPQSRDVETLVALLEAGMTLARFDFSYGKATWHQEALDNLRIAARQAQRLCAVMMDTCGPEIVVINRPDEPITLQAGETITITCDQKQRASSKVLPISHPTLAGVDLQVGSAVFVGTYLFSGSEGCSAYLTVQSLDGNSMLCVCNNNCTLEGYHLTVQIGAMANDGPALTDDDVANITTFGKANHVDFIALSFCRSGQDVRQCRAVLDKHGMKQVQIIAKIENREGIANHSEIMAAADAVIMSRGNLGTCLDPEKMFAAQKMLLRECNLAGKPIYVTRVVDTMVDAPRPTRAEATDVANLVLDGADGIILGSETFRGKFPVLTCTTVRAIARQAEKCFDSFAYYRFAMEMLGIDTLRPNMEKTEALATAAVRAATKLQAALIVVFTVTGRTARLIAKYRPSQPILTVVCDPPADADLGQVPTNQKVVVPRLTVDGHKWVHSGHFQARQCLQYRGVLPICADTTHGSPDGAILTMAFAYAKAQGLLKAGDRVVISQCPRTKPQYDLQEMGVVKILTVDESSFVPAQPRSLKRLTGAVVGMTIGSADNLGGLQ